MRTRTRLTVAAAVLCLTALPAAAQPAPIGPAIVVRVRSLDDLLNRAMYLGDVFGQAEPARQAVGLVRSLVDEKTGLDGIDPARPFALYAFVSPNVTDGPYALMVPIADETAFVDLLRTKLKLDPQKQNDGAYEVAVPRVPTPVYFRFAHKTAYVTVQSVKNVAVDAIIAPEALFASDDGAVASARIHFDRIPADVKKVILGQFELKVADAKVRTDPGETPAQQKLRAWAVGRLMDVVAGVLTDGREFAVRIAVDPKTDELTAEASFTARSGSATAEWLLGIGRQTGLAAGLSSAMRHPVAAAGVRFSLPDSVRPEFGTVIDGLVKELIEKAGANERAVARLVADAVVPTLKAGVLDAGIAAGRPAGGEGLNVLAGLRVVDGSKLEQLVKLGAAFVPEKEAKLTYDVKKAGGLAIHKAAVSNPALKAVTGTDAVWFAIGEDVILVSAEPDGHAIEAAATAKASRVGVADVDIGVARILPVAETALKPEVMARLISEVFGPAGSTDGSDAVRLSFTGGDRLTLRLAVKGRAVKLGVMADQEKKKGD